MADTPQTSIQLGDYALTREVLLDLTKLRDPFPKAGIARDDSASVDETPSGADGDEQTLKSITRSDSLRRRPTVRPIRIPEWPDEREMTYEWTLLDREQNPHTGYDGALFSAMVEGKPQYFIYHLNSNDTGDIGTIGLMVNGHRPEQAINAQEFTDRCLSRIEALHPKRDVPIVDVGYSLGGALAEMVDRKERPTVLFDSPPASAVLDAENVPQAQRDKNVLTVLGPHPALFNSHGRHNGEVLIAGEKFWKTERVSFNDFWRMNEANHELCEIGKRLENMPEWKTVPAAESGRSSHLFDAFVEYIQDNTQGRELRWDEKQLVKQVEHLQTPEGKDVAEKFAVYVFDVASKLFGARKAVDVVAGGFAEKFMQKRSAENREQAVINPAVHQAQAATARGQDAKGRGV